MTDMPHECTSDADQTAVRDELERIMGSGPFVHSRRRQRFLNYIVSESLAGHAERLKAYTIAIEVFDRSDAFDSNVDPVVRIEAARLRDRLREYYEGEGHSDPIRIELPKGCYAPVFQFQSETTNTTPQSEAATTEGPVVKSTEVSAAFQDTHHASNHDSRTRDVDRRMIASVVSLILALGVTGAAWHFGLWAPTSTHSAENYAGSEPAGPLIAVVPFTNLSSDPALDYLGDGLTEDILTELSRARDLRVLASNTTFQSKGKAFDVLNLGRELKVRYVLGGSVQRSADKFRVSAQLIDANTGAHIWAERFDRTVDEISKNQDEIANQIVAKVASGYGVIELSEAKSDTHSSSPAVQAYKLVLHARGAMHWEWNRDIFRSAKSLLYQAIALDPSNRRAHRELTWLAALGWVFRLDQKPMPTQEITSRAKRTVQLDPSDARARMVLASVYFWNKQLDLFEREAEQAITLAPYDSEILAALGCMFAKSGHWERGVALAEKANALNPDAATGWYHSTLSYDFYRKGAYDLALQFRQLHPDQHSITAYAEYIPIYGQLGRKKDALENWRKLLADDPSWSIESFQDWYRMWNMRDADIAGFMEGVNKSGVADEQFRIVR
jgi:TolB-like protein